MLSLRFIFMLLYSPVACGLGFARPFYGLVALVMMYYFRPEVWGAPGWFRPILWITISVAVGWILKVKSFRFTGLMGLSFLALLGMVASAVVAAYDTETAVAAVWIMAKVIIVGFLTLQLVDSARKVDIFLWANIIGMLWNIKTILVLGLVGGGVKEDVRVDVGVGQGGGANYLAMILAMGLPLFFVKFMEGKRWERRFSAIMGPIYVLCIVLTGSRGGFLALFATSCYVVARSHRKVLGFVSLAVCLLVFALALPESQWERLNKGFKSGQERDFAAQSRILLWKAAWTMFTESPILGKGPDNFQLLSPRYAGFYAGNTIKKYQPGVPGRGFVAHSTWFQTIAEGGLAVAVPFFSMFLVAMLSLQRARRIPIRDPVLRGRIRSQSIAMEGLWIAFMTASTFGSHIKIDFLWWYMGLTSAILLNARAALARERAGEAARTPALAAGPASPRRQPEVSRT